MPSPRPSVRELCRAKVNLTLHVGAKIEGGRFDGYHPVESLVVFADFGDVLTFEPSERTSVGFEGPFGDALFDEGHNSVWAAMERVSAPPHLVIIDKQLPLASGLGGGTADAAGVLRVFDPKGRLHGLEIGADGPVCRLSRTALMQGIGDRITPLPGLGQVPAVLVNPGVRVSTASVFETFDLLPRDADPASTDAQGDLLSRAYSGENDLQSAAIGQAPVIAEVLDAINATEGCDLARMSGSGATCFGLYRSEAAAEAAADTLANRGWWARACRLGDPD